MLYPEQSRKWLFPAESESGHMVEHRRGGTNYRSGATTCDKHSALFSQATGTPDESSFPTDVDYAVAQASIVTAPTGSHIRQTSLGPSSVICIVA